MNISILKLVDWTSNINEIIKAVFYKIDINWFISDIEYRNMINDGDVINNNIKCEMKNNIIKMLKLLHLSSKKGNTIIPSPFNLLRCLRGLLPKNIKAVLIGQDPYYNKNKANGLCFSINDNFIDPVPSIDNIINVIEQIESNKGKSVNITCRNLVSWKARNVLLINSSLTVLKNNPISCVKMWDDIVKKILQKINKKASIFMWGEFAKKFKGIFKIEQIYESCHPAFRNKPGFAEDYRSIRCLRELKSKINFIIPISPHISKDGEIDIKEEYNKYSKKYTIHSAFISVSKLLNDKSEIKIAKIELLKKINAYINKNYEFIKLL